MADFVDINTACFISTSFKENLWYNHMILDDKSQIFSWQTRFYDREIDEASLY